MGRPGNLVPLELVFFNTSLHLYSLRLHMCSALQACYYSVQYMFSTCTFFVSNNVLTPSIICAFFRHCKLFTSPPPTHTRAQIHSLSVAEKEGDNPCRFAVGTGSVESWEQYYVLEATSAEKKEQWVQSIKDILKGQFELLQGELSSCQAPINAHPIL